MRLIAEMDYVCPVDHFEAVPAQLRERLKQQLGRREADERPLCRPTHRSQKSLAHFVAHSDAQRYRIHFEALQVSTSDQQSASNCSGIVTTYAITTMNARPFKK